MSCLDRCISQQLPFLGTLDALHVWIGVDAISLGFACAVSAMVWQKCGQTIVEACGGIADKMLTMVYLNMFELFICVFAIISNPVETHLFNETITVVTCQCASVSSVVTVGPC